MKQILQKAFGLRAWMMIAMLMAVVSGAWAQDDYSTDYEGNITLSVTGGTSTSACTVEISGTTYSGIKAGTSKISGAVNVTVPSGTKYLHLHVAAWNNENVSLKVTPEGYSENISLTSDAGVSGGGSNFPLSGSLANYYKVITFSSALEEDTELTFAATGGKRFVIWGVTSEEESSNPGDNSVATTTTIDASGITNTDIYSGTEGGSLTATVVANEDAIEGAIVTWTSSDENVATIDEDGAITLIAAGTTTITASYAGVADQYQSSSDTYILDVTDSTPIPTHTATFSVNGVSSSQDFEEGAAIEFPEDPADVSGKTFVGWVAEAIEETTNDAPEFVTSANMGESDITYYAVFAYASGSGSAEVTKSFGFETESDPDWTITDAITRTEGEGNTGSYAGKINTNDTYVTFNSKVKVKAFSFAFKRTSNNNNYNVYIETSEDNTNWTAAETYAMSSFNNGSYLTKTKEFDGTQELYVRFHCNNTTAARYVDDVTITYIGGGVSYSDYCTTVVAATVARPTIEVEANPFLFSTTAAITCETEGAAIKYSFDEENWNDYAEALTITETTTIYAKAVKNQDESTVASLEITKNLATSTVTIDATGITNTNVFDGTEAGSLAASVTYNEEAVEGAVVTWSGNNDAVATIDAETGAVTLVAAGSVTFTANYAGNSDYAEKTETYVMNVTNSDPNAPGTENNPYSVAEARAAIDAGAGVNGVYATGIVSQIVTAYNSQYGNISYNISADGSTTSDQLQAFRGKSYNGENFTSEDDIQVGDIVVIYGNLKKYNSTYEFDQNNQLVNLDRPVSTEPSITVSPATIEAIAAGADGTITVTYNNITDVVAEVKFCDVNGDEATYDWIKAEINNENNVEYLIEENQDTEARTAYFKVYALDDESNDVYSEILTVTQAGFTVDYAILPFEFDGGRSDIESTSGLTQEGLGTDYNSSPCLKFDGTGDEIILKLNERPGVLSFDIKGNNFSGGTFKVQTSADGVEYTDLDTYTELGNTATMTFNNLAEDIRYIKWVYTEKVYGNVALGNIKMSAYVAPYTREVTEIGNFGTICTREACDVEGAELFSIQSKKEDGSCIYLMDAGSELEAGKAYFFKATATTVTFTPKSHAVDTPVESNGLIGSFEGTTIPVGEYMLKNNMIFECGEGCSIGANRAYIDLESIETIEVEGNVKMMVIGGIATGIQKLDAAAQQGRMFNIAGQRVNKAQRGLYIVNGKKLMVK